MKKTLEHLRTGIIYLMLLIFKVTFGLFTLLRFRTRLIRNDAKHLKGSYLLLSNHTNNYDPIYYQAYLPRVIHYVIADAVFRNAIMRRLLNFMGYIKKRKAVSDVTTIKSMLRMAKKGKVLGLFPEGNRNWDGRTMAFSDAVARLVKLLGIPVVAGNIKGGFLSRPRWGGSLRRGRVDVSLTCILTTQQIKAMSAQDIYQILVQELYQDDLIWQEQQHIRYKSNRIAENLELFLAICPVCHGVFTLRSEGNRFYCSHCDASVTFDEYYHMEKDTRIPFSNIRQWGDWQEEQIAQMIHSCDDQPVIYHDEAVLYESKSEKNYIPIAQGTLALNAGELRFLCEDGTVKTFSVKAMQGICVQFRRGLAFYYDFIDYRVLFKSGKVSAYLWTRAMQLMAEG